MTDVLLDRLQQRADDLIDAYTLNEAAFATFKRAEQRQKKSPCDQHKQALVEAEAAWGKSRSAIVEQAQILMGTLALVLVAKPYSLHASLVKQATYLKDAFHAEAITFNRYSHFSGGSLESWQAWQDARGEIISRARPLIDIVKALPTAIAQSSTPTSVGS